MERPRRFFFLVILASLCLGALSKPTKKFRYDADFLDSEIQRIRSGRASEIEPMWKSSLETKMEEEDPDSKPESANSTSAEAEEGGSSSASGEDDYWSSEEIDITCAPDKGWHIRGQRCVPINCPGGPAERDFNTGECLYAPSSSRGRFNKPFQQWNDLNHVYRSSPMSSHFTRSMVLMRKG